MLHKREGALRKSIYRLGHRSGLNAFKDLVSPRRVCFQRVVELLEGSALLHHVHAWVFCDRCFVSLSILSSEGNGISVEHLLGADLRVEVVVRLLVLHSHFVFGLSFLSLIAAQPAVNICVGGLLDAARILIDRLQWRIFHLAAQNSRVRTLNTVLCPLKIESLNFFFYRILPARWILHALTRAHAETRIFYLLEGECFAMVAVVNLAHSTCECMYVPKVFLGYDQPVMRLLWNWNR